LGCHTPPSSRHHPSLASSSSTFPSSWLNFYLLWLVRSSYCTSFNIQ
jgi:hypothetical protein